MMGYRQSTYNTVVPFSEAGFYAIIELECIPDCLKTGIITPVYKGGGKDLLDTNSYRGVTLLAKVLEFSSY